MTHEVAGVMPEIKAMSNEPTNRKENLLCQAKQMREEAEAIERFANDPDREDIEVRFTYHAPDPKKAELHRTIRNEGKFFAELLLRNISSCRERSLAITKIEEAIMWANAGIARRIKNE